MKKYLIIVIVIVLLLFGADTAVYRLGWYIDLDPDGEVSCSFKAGGSQIFVKRGDAFEAIEIKGVDMGSGIPGKWSTDFALDKETCLRWFGQISEMGANTVRVYTVQSEEFYEAFYEYNQGSQDPLYLLQGVWVDEYAQFSHLDGWSDEFCGTFLSDARRAVDVIHGKRKIAESESVNAGSGHFRWDVSPWVLGYIIGVEWEGDVTAYTNDKYKNDPGHNTYQGTYLKTSEDAAPFEAMLTYVADGMISYETGKYKTQRLLAVSNWPATDPFEYPLGIQEELHKDVSIDTEHIRKTDAFLAGQFASYHIYPYYPCYINYLDDWSIYGIQNKLDYMDEDGIRSYRAYLKGLVNHHQMPVVISEFGVPASRGKASRDIRTGRDQGDITEQEQGEYLVECYRDIKAAGCAGCCLFSWQDEWFKRTWNTLHAVDLKRNPYWSDAQTNEQSFGVLAFDPGKEETVCLPDGKTEEWSEEDLVLSENGYRLYCKYDEKYLYFCIRGTGDLKDRKIYVPIDTIQKSGSSTCERENITFDRAADFLLLINGEQESRLLVQERYDALRSTFSRQVYGINTYLKKNIPDKDSPVFTEIMLPLQEPTKLIYGEGNALEPQYETGKLTCGNADPEAADYNSLTDIAFADGAVEIRLAWQLLNFSDPSQMEIHDDYYENYGVAYLSLNELWMGVGSEENSLSGKQAERIRLVSKEMKGWGMKPTAHERLKQSYYAMQKAWTEESTEEGAGQSSTMVTICAEYDVPALMYHDFADHEEAIAEGTGDQLGTYAIWDDEFEEDLIYLKQNGYTAITCEQLQKARNGEGELPEKPVLLTIDDGREGVYKVAYPLLKKYGMTASLAVACKYVDEETKQSEEIREHLFCTWNEITEMSESGCIEVISHTYNFHQQEDEELKVGASLDVSDEETALQTAADDFIKVQDRLMRRIGKRTSILSYPYSVRDSESDKIWTETGYRMFLCGDPYTLKDNRDFQYLSERCSTETVCLVPRTPRLHGENTEFYLDQHAAVIRNVRK